MVFQAEESLYKGHVGVENGKYDIPGAKTGRKMVVRDVAPGTSLAVPSQNCQQPQHPALRVLTMH